MKNTTLAWGADSGAAEEVRRVLPLLTSELFAAGRRAGQGEIKLKRLHRFRLDVKHFRYTLEIFQPLYGPALDQRLTQLRKLQEHLGLINDCAVARNLVKSTSAKKTPKLREALRSITEIEKKRVGAYLVFWREVFDAPSEEARWVNYLRQYAGRRKATGVTAIKRAAVEPKGPIVHENPSTIH